MLYLFRAIEHVLRGKTLQQYIIIIIITVIIIIIIIIIIVVIIKGGKLIWMFKKRYVSGSNACLNGLTFTHGQVECMFPGKQ